ncbi:LOW QUALITY PROTEIN: MICOS complex subunit Mic19 [Drosophila ficusphila]|uniref:LOW QUALITY PROTEIN: MICOS complex subunit Mic19 n=1 Tax=Drosophila ficusphila TaxID=30025 RepID=UPI001C89E2BA|nr:LOW QUALITY PROTEIN: MICOS complex subunit Mic19 [Drosophila ficusphila]
MGARQSQSREPRSVSMENPTPAGVIDISDDVVKRLKAGISQQAREHAAAAEDSKPASKPKAAAKPATSSPAPAPAAPVPGGYPAAVPIYVQGGGHTISAADVQRQMNQELVKNDELWKERMTKLEENLKKTNTILEKEYANAVENVHKRFVSTASTHKVPPCQDLKSQLLACYRAHPGETLKCMEEVAQFRQCIDLHRVKKLDAEPEAPKAASKTTVPAKAA